MSVSWSDRFVAIDVEIASRSPIQVCAIAAVRFEKGHETGSFSSLVAVEGRVRFTQVHGLTAADLADAPAWHRVWRGVAGVMADIRTLVAFRAAFDRGAILAMSGRHGVRLPRMRFMCAAEIMRANHGGNLGLKASLDLLGLEFPGRPHDPLADARAAAAIVIACAGTPTPTLQPIQLSQNR